MHKKYLGNETSWDRVSRNRNTWWHHPDEKILRASEPAKPLLSVQGGGVIYRRKGESKGPAYECEGRLEAVSYLRDRSGSRRITAKQAGAALPFGVDAVIRSGPVVRPSDMAPDRNGRIIREVFRHGRLRPEGGAATRPGLYRQDALDVTPVGSASPKILQRESPQEL